MNTTQIIQSMAESILTKIQSAISQAKFDKTYTATVTEKVGVNKYNLLFNGQIHLAKSSITLAVGDTVMACSPQGNDSDLFVICKI